MLAEAEGNSGMNGRTTQRRLQKVTDGYKRGYKRAPKPAKRGKADKAAHTGRQNMREGKATLHDMHTSLDKNETKQNSTRAKHLGTAKQQPQGKSKPLTQDTRGCLPPIPKIPNTRMSTKTQQHTQYFDSNTSDTRDPPGGPT